jgi:pimeloyl-ACP methyl ester carboxylesterase
VSINPCARILFIALVLAPQVRSTATAASQAREASLVTRTVNVDGLSIRVRTAGLGDRRPGQAAVVFESGGSAPLETWDRVLPAVANFAPVVAYDRAGTGESSWDELPPTPQRIGQRLQRLLSTLDVAPPYVLVGHSWGGALVRNFAGHYPEQIAGVLYIDPTDITLTRADLVALFESIGAGAAEYDAFNRTMERALSAAPAPIRAEAAVVMDLLDRDIGDRGMPTPPRVPTSVIVAGRVAAPPSNLVPFDAQAYAKAMHESQVRRLRSWAIDGGTFEVATNSGHVIQADDPERVIAAIRHLVVARR